jgi:hypothetical protein
MGELDPELALIVRALAHAAVSRDRALRRPWRPRQPSKGSLTQSRIDGDPHAHSDLRKVQQPAPEQPVD